MTTQVLTDSSGTWTVPGGLFEETFTIYALGAGASGQADDGTGIGVGGGGGFLTMDTFTASTGDTFDYNITAPDTGEYGSSGTTFAGYGTSGYYYLSAPQG